MLRTPTTPPTLSYFEGGIIFKSYVEDYHKPLLSLLYTVYFTLVSLGDILSRLPYSWELVGSVHHFVGVK